MNHDDKNVTPSHAILTLLTDFGEQDGFVGVMKGTILKINPNARIIDISHQIPSHQIDAAAFVLHTSYSYFPERSIHIVVVDPGVGSNRRIIACSASTHIFLAPDNGVLKYIFHEFKSDSVIQVSNRDYFLDAISHTFHGRDIFAPVAAHLSRSTHLSELGESISGFERGTVLLPQISENIIRGQIIYIDKFGNLITNIKPENIPNSISNAKLTISGQDFKIDGIYDCYADAASTEPLALWGSHGYLEIAVNQKRANAVLKMTYNDQIVIYWN